MWRRSCLRSDASGNENAAAAVGRTGMAEASVTASSHPFSACCGHGWRPAACARRMRRPGHRGTRGLPCGPHMLRPRRRQEPPRPRGLRRLDHHPVGRGSCSLPQRRIRPEMVDPVDCRVVLAGTGSGLGAETHTVVVRVRCIHSPEEVAGSPDKVSGVQRSSVATGEGMAGRLAVHTGYMTAEGRQEIHKTAAVELHKAHVAADMGREARMAMDCDGPVAWRIDYTGPAYWL